jgi:hypothetical protein
MHVNGDSKSRFRKLDYMMVMRVSKVRFINHFSGSARETELINRPARKHMARQQRKTEHTFLARADIRHIKSASKPLSIMLDMFTDVHDYFDLAVRICVPVQKITQIASWWSSADRQTRSVE